MSYRIANRVYATKKSLTEKARSVLYAYPAGTRVTAPDDHAFLCGLLDMHEHRDQEVGVGVKSFEVERNPAYPTAPSFWLTRIDGSRTDWSFVNCISRPSPERKAKSSFRREIEDQIVAFKDAAFIDTESIRCPISGDWVTRHTCHVDHVVPFDSLLLEFIRGTNVNLADVERTQGHDGDVRALLVDRGLADAWSRYHQTHAQLRIVSVTANLSTLRKRASK